MTRNAHYDLDRFMSALKERNPHQAEFHQAVCEVFADILPEANEHARACSQALLERLSEPERVVSFRVVWEDDSGGVHVNRGYRVQFSSAIGPYKGGLRFHPTVSDSVLKFLAFEQTFKNALTGLPLGGGKGGADFDPKGRSDREIMRFCVSFMTELHRHIGPDIDIPAGDINVGEREIGYLFGAYRRITNEFEGALTGKGISYGGSELRSEATGYGLVHFVQLMLEKAGRSLDGKKIVVSGAGNVATHAAEKATDMGGCVVTMSDSGGFIHDSQGIDREKIDWIRRHKAGSGNSLADYADHFDAQWYENRQPWDIACDVALPCATQNELDEDAARTLIEQGCGLIAEGANMPLTAEAVRLVRERNVLFGPAKAANAGGVAVSGLEISQNSIGVVRSHDDISESLREIMATIHERCVEEGQDDDGQIDYARGANRASFRKIANAMIAQGIA